MNQKITLIAALTPERIIGNDNTLPWHIPEDFAFFKQYTSHKPIVMGRKTWDSLPKKPLPNRRNLVITRQTNWQNHQENQNCEVYPNIQAALSACADEPEIVIIGGAEIYTQTLPLATDLRLTLVKLSVAGDALFPEIPTEQWTKTSGSLHLSQNQIEFEFQHWQRKKPENRADFAV